MWAPFSPFLMSVPFSTFGREFLLKRAFAQRIEGYWETWRTLLRFVFAHSPATLFDAAAA